MPATLYLVRHGETDWNRDGRLQGQQDIPLNAIGRRQAAEAARRLAGLLPPERLARVPFLVSPMARVRETMALMAGALGVADERQTLDTRLVEIGFGRWEGLTWPEVRTSDPAGHAARARDIWNFVPPGGESYADLAARIEPVIDALVEDTVIVSHGGVARAILALRAGVPKHEAGGLDIHQGKVLVLEGDRARWV